MFRLLTVLLASAATLVATQPKDPAELAAALDAALVARDVSALRALVHQDGLSPADLAAMEPSLAALIPADAKAVVTPDRLPDGIDIARPRIANGVRIELNHPPAGIIRIEVKEGRAKISSTLPYALVDGTCLLVGAKRADLGWRGPPDQSLGFTFVDEFPPLPCAITIRYNASGVDLEDRFTRPSGSILGQHIEEFTIRDLPGGFKGRIILREGKTEIFRSEPLLGQAAFTYRRPSL